MKPLPQTAPVVIIGGGICGVSTLYHLAKRGVPAVLLERKKLASGTTWHAAGIVGQLRDSSAQTELGKYTANLFRTLEEETGQGTGYKQNGTINLALSDVRLDQSKRSHDHAGRMGIESRLIDNDELRAFWPWLDVSGVQGAFYVPSNGQVNPLDVTVALAKGAKANGAQVFEDTEVTGLSIKDGRVLAVETGRGTVATDKVLLAGGMWSHRFALRYGLTVPLHAVEHFYILTEAVPDLSPKIPILNIIEERTYWKEDAGKLLIGAFEAKGKPWGRDGIPESFEFDELPFDMDHLEPELERMFERMPALADMGIQTFFNGPESFTPDGRPYLGPVPDVSGVFVATGMNSNGILNSGGVGLTMAEWLIDGSPSRSMGPLAASRAHPFQKNSAYCRDRSAESIGFHYGLSWPGRQIDSARGIRRVPLHDRLVAKGAVMAERIGWEVPMYFDPDANGNWPSEPTLGWHVWSDAVETECLAAMNDCVLVDQSMYAKLLVRGSDAVHALNRVCGAQMDVATGSSVYTQFLNERGGIEADVTVTRLSPDEFLVLTGHPSQIRDRMWIERHADPNWSFSVFDATAAYGLLTVHGPKSRDLLQSVSEDDLSNDALPFGAAAEIDIAYARAWVIRRSFFGELGFEVLISTEFSAHVFDAIEQAGQSHSLLPAGMFAMNQCRLEKAFRHFGHDIGEDDTPYETGLGFAVDLNKPDFLGRDALLRQKQRATPPTDRLVSVAVKSADKKLGPFLSHNEPVWRDGIIIGHVTSGGWGHRVERLLGLASIHNGQGVSRDWIAGSGFEVQIAGEKHPIEVQLQPFYDPGAERMRG